MVLIFHNRRELSRLYREFEKTRGTAPLQGIGKDARYRASTGIWKKTRGIASLQEQEIRRDNRVSTGQAMVTGN
jgi:hypothetical protein